MSTTSPTPSHRERDLRAITADGVFFSVMVGLGEAYVPAFARLVSSAFLAAQSERPGERYRRLQPLQCAGDRAPRKVRLRTLAVRPSGVAVQRPILTSVSSEAPEAPAPRDWEE